jgi:hypothetical protein
MSDFTVPGLVAISLIILAIVPAMIAGSKGYPGAGWYFLSLIIWPIGLTGAVLLPAKGTLLDRMRTDGQTGYSVSYDDAGRWYWYDGVDWHRFQLTSDVSPAPAAQQVAIPDPSKRQKSARRR